MKRSVAMLGWGSVLVLVLACVVMAGPAWARAYDGGPDLGPKAEEAQAEPLPLAEPAVKAPTGEPLSAAEFAALFNETHRQTIKTPDWEKVEEPALRPYKSFINGVGAVGYQTVRSFAEGNEKLPVLGSVEALRGFRRGTFAMVEGTYKSMAGAPAIDYRYLGQANTTIEREPLLNFAADALQGLPLSVPSGGTERGVAMAVGVFAAQKATDYSPVSPTREEREYESKVRRAQRDYLGEKARVNDKGARGNLLKKYGTR